MFLRKITLKSIEHRVYSDNPKRNCAVIKTEFELGNGAGAQDTAFSFFSSIGLPALGLSLRNNKTRRATFDMDIGDLEKIIHQLELSAEVKGDSLEYHLNDLSRKSRSYVNELNLLKPNCRTAPEEVIWRILRTWREGFWLVIK